jgi:catechol 2,3-dioxygenase-like lactoylglutathione lyase family enzyme
VAVELNHTIVPSRDKVRSSRFLAEILGIAPPEPVMSFMAVHLSNSVTLDYQDADDFRSQHFAFLVGDDEFDAIFDRVTARGILYYADPSHGRPGELRRRDGGRGFYFSDPDGHNMEVFSVVPPP